MKLIHIVAKNPKTFQRYDLYYKSIKEAKFHNPSFIDFEIVGR